LLILIHILLYSYLFILNFLYSLKKILIKILWGLGIGDWGFGPIPNPQSPIPNPQSPIIS